MAKAITLDSHRSVKISGEHVILHGDLALPDPRAGIVLFAHGSGSSRHSSRNRYVAQVLNKAGIGSLLFDLLTEEEDEVYETRFNIELLTRRLLLATHWLKGQPAAKGLPLGYFGASTGAAAALMAAAELGPQIRCVVSRGGRPDMAAERLDQVRSPTLLLVGGDDEPVIGMNQEAYAQLHCPKELAIIPGATHLFEEPGTLEEVARLAAKWFLKYLIVPSAERS
jgi:pimeloyl-ACP methyl ester carboxylesterase